MTRDQALSVADTLDSQAMAYIAVAKFLRETAAEMPIENLPPDTAGFPGEIDYGD